MTTRSLIALAALALSVVACGGSDGPTGNNGGDDMPGSFTGTVSGDLQKSVTGGAVYGETAYNDGFGLFMGNEDAGFIFGREAQGSLGVGAHQVFDLANGEEEEAPASNLLGVLGLTIGNVDYICVPDGGTVTVTTSTASRLAGSVNVTAECITTGSQVTKSVTITGNFDAVRGDIDD